MKREIFVLKMARARMATVRKYATGEIGRNEYFELIDKINGAMLNDKLGINKYID
jgi:hypothetical protein